MDWSDELNHGSGTSCSFTPNAMECDEHICPPQSFSCGDGQCVDWITRMAFQRFAPAKEDCYTKRNLNYMCEVSPHQRAWTLLNGLCWSGDCFDDLTYPSWNMLNNSNVTSDEKCQYLLRCALSDGLERDCPCNRLNCSQIMSNVCRDNSLLLYPQAGLISPNILFYYELGRSDNIWNVSGMIPRGTQRCRGYQATVNNYMRRSFSPEAVMHADISSILCTLNEGSMISTNYSSTLQYDKFCYNDSFTFSGRQYAVNPDVCNRSDQCISQYRIRDGFFNCFYGHDEDHLSDKSYCVGNVGQYRFQCYNDEHKCLPLSKLDSGRNECSNNYDEGWYGTGMSLSANSKCQKGDTDRCDRLKEYIRESSLKNTRSFDHMSSQTSINHIPFRSYCDSF